MTFAKIFDTEFGQVVAMIQSSDDGYPEIRFFAKPPELDVCSIAFGYTNGDWDKAEEGFAKVDLEMATKAAKQIMEVLK